MAESEFAASVMTQLRRPIRLCSWQRSRWRPKRDRAGFILYARIAKERFAGWWLFGSTLQLPQSVWDLCPSKRPKLRYISYGTICRFLAARTRKIHKTCHDSYSYLLVQQLQHYFDVRQEKSNPTYWNHFEILATMSRSRFLEDTKNCCRFATL